MNKFLRQQLENKVEKFLKDKSDQFVVEVVSWFAYGGILEGTPKNMSQEDFQQLKELLGEDLLGKYVMDSRGENKFFSAMSMSDRDFMETFYHLLMDHCYQRLRKNVYTELTKKAERKVKRLNKKLEKIYTEVKEKESQLQQLETTQK
jgi:hypothetical protein